MDEKPDAVIEFLRGMTAAADPKGGSGPALDASPCFGDVYFGTLPSFETRRAYFAVVLGTAGMGAHSVELAPVAMKAPDGAYAAWCVRLPEGTLPNQFMQEGSDAPEAWVYLPVRLRVTLAHIAESMRFVRELPASTLEGIRDATERFERE